ncbi:MAG TPA: sulfatase-like hydrolase/transferase [Candidatus Hydrogenedentes bacterium]|nr:sulfatase-like hydrolase/transferase [Candidatus Hydrogenedentota bacterium]
MPKKTFLFLIKLAVTVGLFVLLFRPETFGLRPNFWGEQISPRLLIAEIRAVGPHALGFWMGLAIIIKLSGMMAGVVRWHLLLIGQGIRVPFVYLVQSWFIGRTIGIFLPGTIGLDGYRLYDSARYSGEVIKTTTVIAVEKLTGFIALTLLVFCSFPLGRHLLRFNTPILALCMIAFGGFVVVALLLLLNPRIIQSAVAMTPVPRAVRDKFDKVGKAVAAYGSQRKLLLTSLFFGILVHVATCLVYFCTMSALRPPNTTIGDIFFTSPLMIWGTVLGPSVGGEGIREAVFTSILGAKSGTVKAFLIGHLGWWVTELVPFLIGLPIFLLRSRPDSAQKQTESTPVHRSSFAQHILAGAYAGLLAGSLAGALEGGWILRTLHGLHEAWGLAWGAASYGIVFGIAGIGAGIAAALFWKILQVHPRPLITFAACTGIFTTAALLAIGHFRFQRDVLAGHAFSLKQIAFLTGISVTAGVVLAAIALTALWRLRGSSFRAAMGALTAYALILAGTALTAWGLAAAMTPPTTIPATSTSSNGPNIILIALDACRADALPLFSPTATAKTPHLEAFAQNAVRFGAAFSQASWTKPSFATIFTGKYPESHTATSKTAALPDDVPVFPELLTHAGYFTKGFSNNPNITSVFGFARGFSSYIDLKPALYFWASPSAANLSLYQALRQARQRIEERLPWSAMRVTDFYQPAETVTRTGLSWIDSDERPANAPFFLFLHYMETHDPFMDWEHPGVGYARVRMEAPDPARYREKMLHAYAQEVERFDHYFGELIAGLQARNLYENTLIVVVSDHGEEFFDHGGWWHGQTLYDELLHVPLLIKLPGNLAGGTTNDHFARHIDIAPTILAWANLPPSPSMPGTSLLGPDGSALNAQTGYVYAHNDFEGIILHSAQTRDAKRIEANPGNKRTLAPVEFYDLANDPSERTNLSGKGDPRETELGMIIEGMSSFLMEGATQPTLVEKASPEMENQLKSLGYLQ